MPKRTLGANFANPMRRNTLPRLRAKVFSSFGPKWTTSSHCRAEPGPSGLPSRSPWSSLRSAFGSRLRLAAPREPAPAAGGAPGADQVQRGPLFPGDWHRAVWPRIRHQEGCMGGSVAVLFGTLTAMEGLIGVDLKIDELFARDSLLVDTVQPGRGSVMASCCIALAGVTALLAAFGPRSPGAPVRRGGLRLGPGLGGFLDAARLPLPASRRSTTGARTRRCRPSRRPRSWSRASPS